MWPFKWFHDLIRTTTEGSPWQPKAPKSDMSSNCNGPQKNLRCPVPQHPAGLVLTLHERAFHTPKLLQDLIAKHTEPEGTPPDAYRAYY